MPVVYCQQCGKKNRAPDNAVGRQGQCSQCKTLMTIPAQDDPEPANEVSNNASQPQRVHINQAALTENVLAVLVITGVLIVGGLVFYLWNRPSTSNSTTRSDSPTGKVSIETNATVQKLPMDKTSDVSQPKSAKTAAAWPVSSRSRLAEALPT